MALRKRIAVIFGGRSGEHEVSVMSAKSIIDALDPEKYEVIPVGITRAGRWLYLENPESVFALSEVPENGIPTALLGDPSNQGLLGFEGEQEPSFVPREIDVVFPILHGPYGEDGTIQGLLELADIPYVGAGVTSSAVSMDKSFMKRIFEYHGLPVVSYVVLTAPQFKRNPDAAVNIAEEKLGYPIYVKPANLGSSVGISKAKDRSGLLAAIHEAFKCDRKIILEDGVDARELECGVLGNDEPEASVVGEVVVKREFYDYEAKYQDEGTSLVIPADIPQETSDEIRDIALKAFKAVDCAGLARVDFFLERGTNRIYLNEINTIPGFTKMSMYPRLFAASGLPYNELVDRLVDLALKRFHDKR